MKEISAQELQSVLATGDKSKFAVVDVRTAAEHRAECIPNVMNIPLEEIDRHADRLKEYDAVYLQCQSGRRSGMACDRLEALGLTNLVSVHGGLMSWKACGYDTEKSGGPTIPLFRQVMIVAGSLVLIGVTLSYFVHEAFVLLSFGVGLGLIYGGSTGNCLMEKLLVKMPWNK